MQFAVPTAVWESYCYPTAGVITLGTIDILGKIILCWGWNAGWLWMVGYLVAPLASTYLMLVAPFPQCDNQKCLQKWLHVPRGGAANPSSFENHPLCLWQHLVLSCLSQYLLPPQILACWYRLIMPPMGNVFRCPNAAYCFVFKDFPITVFQNRNYFISSFQGYPDKPTHML